MFLWHPIISYNCPIILHEFPIISCDRPLGSSQCTMGAPVCFLITLKMHPHWLPIVKMGLQMWLQWREIGKNNLGDVWHLLRNLYDNLIEKIGLKAPGSYSGSFWSNKFSTLLLERPKPNIFMISGFLTPGNPYLWIWIYQITFENMRKSMGTF